MANSLKEEIMGKLRAEREEYANRAQAMPLGSIAASSNFLIARAYGDAIEIVRACDNKQC